jgi:hypothetical protein
MTRLVSALLLIGLGVLTYLALRAATPRRPANPAPRPEVVRHFKGQPGPDVPVVEADREGESGRGLDPAGRPERGGAPTNPGIALATEMPGLQPSSMPAETVLESMRTAIRQYGSMFGENPVGTNPEITRELAGENSKGVNFLKSDDGHRVNRRGELVDAWGTPYFFHQLSGNEMEIRSAGPDRKMWTGDDLLVR